MFFLIIKWKKAYHIRVNVFFKNFIFVLKSIGTENKLFYTNEKKITFLYIT